ncbi:hypothetical protein JB92DRAFT_3126858 [Gautieria morchelliformis]|nr:hypothetical protein JB92DRAFT_3126858 [Gautieria morchelliformis]
MGQEQTEARMEQEQEQAMKEHEWMEVRMVQVQVQMEARMEREQEQEKAMGERGQMEGRMAQVQQVMEEQRNPGDTDVLHYPSDGDPMDIDNLISNDSESPLPTGGDRPIDHCHVENNAMIISEDHHSDTTALLPSLDLADRIRGYRLLELISVQASSGLVNKVIISQEPLSRFINYVSPGTYVSLTHVNFTTLDQFLIKPIGVYGSKSEIVRLLLEIKAIDEDTALFS